jgi:hypothetical protein
MSRKTTLLPHLLSGLGTMSATLTSEPVNIDYTDNVGLQVKITTSNAVGVVTVEASINGVDFVALTLVPALPAVASASQSYLISLNQIPYHQIRVKYARTSGTGTLAVTVEAKSV